MTGALRERTNRIKSSVPWFPEDDIKSISSQIEQCLRNGELRSSTHRDAFQDEFARYSGVEHVLAMNSGSAALDAIFRSLDLKAGDEVIVPTNTFVASAAMPHALGLDIRFVDMDPATLSPTLDDIEQAIGPRTRAVVIVHMGGVMSPELPKIAELCERRGVYLVEDAAHATGAQSHSLQAGHFGIAAIHSLYPTKVITGGEGGLVVTRSAELAWSVEQIREQGRSAEDMMIHERIGTNYRMSELQAILVRHQLARLDEILAQRREIKSFYDSELMGLHAFKPPGKLPNVAVSGYKYWLHTDTTERGGALAEYAIQHGVELPSGIQDVPCHRQPVFTFAHALSLPRAEHFCSHHICLPIYPGMTIDDCQLVVDVVREFDRSCQAE